MTWWNDAKTQETTLSLVLEQVSHMMNRVHVLTPPLQPDKVYLFPLFPLFPPPAFPLIVFFFLIPNFRNLFVLLELAQKVTWQQQI